MPSTQAARPRRLGSRVWISATFALTKLLSLDVLCAGGRPCTSSTSTGGLNYPVLAESLVIMLTVDEAEATIREVGQVSGADQS